jgi:hypothetical protein
MSETERTRDKTGIAAAMQTFGLVSALLPKRVVHTELDDALKDIEGRVANQRPAIEIRLKIGATVIWAFVHTALYLLRRIAKAVGIGNVIKVFKG